MGHEDFGADSIKASLSTRFMGRRVYFYETLPTTMDVADAKAREGAPEGTVVVAERQTSGRGRFGRSWVSPKGNLYLSVVLRPTREVLPQLPVLSGVAVARAIRKTTRLEPRIKWPNDVLINGKKVCGILLTSSLQGDRPEYVNAGIGINANLGREVLSHISPPATSLSDELGHPVSRLRVFTTLMEELEELYLSVRRGDSLLPQWEPYIVTLGQQVQVQWRREDLEGYVERGYAESVDEEGRLLLRLPGGTLKRLVAGEVTLHSQGP